MYVSHTLHTYSPMSDFVAACVFFCPIMDIHNIKWHNDCIAQTLLIKQKTILKQLQIELSATVDDNNTNAIIPGGYLERVMLSSDDKSLQSQGHPPQFFSEGSQLRLLLLTTPLQPLNLQVAHIHTITVTREKKKHTPQVGAADFSHLLPLFISSSLLFLPFPLFLLSLLFFSLQDLLVLLVLRFEGGHTARGARGR